MPTIHRDLNQLPDRRGKSRRQTDRRRDRNQRITIVMLVGLLIWSVTTLQTQTDRLDKNQAARNYERVTGADQRCDTTQNAIEAFRREGAAPQSIRELQGNLKECQGQRRVYLRALTAEQIKHYNESR